jgi:hypothetical protein
LHEAPAWRILQDVPFTASRRGGQMRVHVLGGASQRADTSLSAARQTNHSVRHVSHSTLTPGKLTPGKPERCSGDQTLRLPTSRVVKTATCAIKGATSRTAREAGLTWEARAD